MDGKGNERHKSVTIDNFAAQDLKQRENSYRQANIQKQATKNLNKHYDKMALYASNSLSIGTASMTKKMQDLQKAKEKTQVEYRQRKILEESKQPYLRQDPSTSQNILNQKDEPKKEDGMVRRLTVAGHAPDIVKKRSTNTGSFHVAPKASALQDLGEYKPPNKKEMPAGLLQCLKMQIGDQKKDSKSSLISLLKPLTEEEQSTFIENYNLKSDNRRLKSREVDEIHHYVETLKKQLSVGERYYLCDKMNDGVTHGADLYTQLQHIYGISISNYPSMGYKTLALKILLDQVSESRNAPALNPQQILSTRYLRLTKENVKHLEDWCTRQGRSVDHTHHCDDDDLISSVFSKEKDSAPEMSSAFKTQPNLEKKRTA